MGLYRMGPWVSKSIGAPPEGIDAKSHTDGICLNSSVRLDGEMILDKGRVVHPELKAMADEIFK